MPVSLERSQTAYIGGATLDVYAPLGNVAKGHRPGGKVGWTDDDPRRFEALRASGAPEHCGGNALNAFAYGVTRRKPGEEVVFFSVRGVDDPASAMIANHLNTMGTMSIVGVVDKSAIVPGNKPAPVL